jgi:hypothetical protein
MRNIILLALANVSFACGGTDDTTTSAFDKKDQPANEAPAQEQAPQSGSLGEQVTPPKSDEPAKVVFYANTDTTLYRLDPEDLSKPIEKVGDFDCVADGQTSVFTDVAVDKTGKVFGVSPAAAWPLTIKADGTVHCDAKWPLAYGTHFNGLTFAPEKTVDVNEVLIGGNATGDIYRIDTGTGEATQIGTLGNDPDTGLPWTISGDMVFMANNGNPIGFASVRTCPSPPSNCSSNDWLLEIDVKALKPGTQSVAKTVRGKLNRGTSCGGSTSTGSFGSVFGVAAYKDKIFGFSRKGDFIDVSNDTGSGCLVWSNTATKFAGAGITTIAPVTAPPPR